jgi:hypothetical protein
MMMMIIMMMLVMKVINIERNKSKVYMCTLCTRIVIRYVTKKKIFTC